MLAMLSQHGCAGAGLPKRAWLKYPMHITRPPRRASGHCRTRASRAGCHIKSISGWLPHKLPQRSSSEERQLPAGRRRWQGEPGEGGAWPQARRHRRQRGLQSFTTQHIRQPVFRLVRTRRHEAASVTFKRAASSAFPILNVLNHSADDDSGQADVQFRGGISEYGYIPHKRASTRAQRCIF